MSTQKLYYEDCHMQTFSATVTGCIPAEGGFLVTLDRTAFYPEGGGQACDTGTLADARVTDVQEKQGQIYHRCDRPVAVGAEVFCKLDWDRRFDLMQQHTGEHLLSGLIFQRYGYHNSGFHVGAQVMEVDFDGPISPEDIWELELEANRLIWANLPVECSWPSPEELPHIPYRTKRELPWPVRIVHIPHGDTCACCGVHVAHTGEVGLIKILSCVALRGGVRLEMVCGQRAYAYLQSVFLQNRQISQALSAKMLETAPAVKKLSENFAAEKFRSEGLQRQVFQFIAHTYRGKDFALCFQQGLTGAQLRELADCIAEHCPFAAVFSGEDDRGYNLCLISKQQDMRQLGAQLTKALGGRGGGKPGAFQGTVSATRKEIEAFFNP